MKAVLALLLLLTATAAQAQIDPTQETGSRIYTHPRNSTDAGQIARFSKLVARCAFTRIGAQPIDRMLRVSDPRTLATDRSGVEWHRLENALEECMGDRMVDWNADVRLADLEMGFTDTRLRALLLEEAYLDAHEMAPTVPPDAGELTNRLWVSTGTELAAARGVGNFADCIVHRNAAGADAVLRTEPGSPQERAAARALGPDLSACLIEGQGIGFSAASIRAMAADGLWSRAFLGSQQLAEQ